MPCDHTSDDQKVELGQTDGANQLVSISLACLGNLFPVASLFNLLPVASQLTILASTDEEVKGDGTETGQGKDFMCSSHFERSCRSARSIVSLRRYMSKTGVCKKNMLFKTKSTGQEILEAEWKEADALWSSTLTKANSLHISPGG